MAKCGGGPHRAGRDQCGAFIGASDDNYRKAGATILDSAREVFALSEMIVKVKEPQPSEWTQLRENQDPFYLSAFGAGSGTGESTAKVWLHRHRLRTMTDPQGGLPLLAPMSEVAGRLAIEAAGAALKRHAGGRGLLIGDVPGV
ncbi:hypothetical protein IVB30_32640 [Bradyrhizobium sp. 200]|uniref:hypothetical protein n=1 Tax=Bradyrhizobium sp. 200 TaxID=2782665 RepID=UPI001FFF4B73|nr:hypothetical protein [Bradyrhizobium sp. 200]UPJ47897.1 hypothetical protein IVB30_32640 [Bradyrhizobium sp. 200]